MLKRFFSNLGINCLTGWHAFLSGASKVHPSGWNAFFIQNSHKQELLELVNAEIERRVT